MPGYTRANLEQLEDAAVGFGLSPNMEARFARKALESERSGLSLQRLAPNFELAFAHKHGAQEETYVIVSGSGRMQVDGETFELAQWDAVRVAPDSARSFAAGPDGLELLAFGAGESGDAEMLEADWSE